MRPIPRALGWFPIAAGVYTTVFYALREEATAALWVCNASNFTLGVAILRGLPRCAMFSGIWLFLGTPLWVWDCFVREWYFTPQAFCEHVVGSALAVWAVSTWPWRGRRVWLPSLAIFAALQAFTRRVGDSTLNVNVSAEIYPPFQPYFANYWAYWAFNLVLMIPLVVGAELLLAWIGRRLDVRSELPRHGIAGESPPA